MFASKRKGIQRGKFPTITITNLPTELILHVVNSIPSVPIPYISQSYYQEKHISRSNTLLSFSQTCRYLREIVFPLVWVTLEVCNFPALPTDDTGNRLPYGMARSGANLQQFKQWESEISRQLMRQLEIVTIRDPSRACIVKCVPSPLSPR